MIKLKNLLSEWGGYSKLKSMELYWLSKDGKLTRVSHHQSYADMVTKKIGDESLNEMYNKLGYARVCFEDDVIFVNTSLTSDSVNLTSDQKSSLKQFSQQKRTNVYDYKRNLVNLDEISQINESFREGNGWMVHEGTNIISAIFEDGKKLSFELTFRNKTGDDKNSWRTKSASKWVTLAREIYNSPEINEIGNTKQKTWYECFNEVLQNEELKQFIKDPNKTPVFDPVNFTPRI